VEGELLPQLDVPRARLSSRLHPTVATASQPLHASARLAIISYHSLEDRRVKRTFRNGALTNREPLKDIYGNVLSPWKPLGPRKPIIASEKEIEFNSRSRSARLRVAERTGFGLAEEAAEES